jgi:ATP-dependent Clp protease adaptor protein ClpS
MKDKDNNYIHMSGEKAGSSDPGVAIEDRQKLQKPSMYKVLLHNDDYTTMEFVVHILQRFFAKNAVEAQAIMLKVHHEGYGICGIYTFEVAESKVNKVNRYARSKGHPLKCSYEPCDSED